MTILASADGRRRAALSAARIFMGLLFLSVWTYNLQHHLYSTSGYAAFVGIFPATPARRSWPPFSGMS